ncbi:Zeatin O-glucosyltransferase [Sesamum angolense]|uniref:Glycosyltransferase n=1 Tax=Sesamum angolense TaxID=2727404 RepID=A0AAE1X479_9LAMI|nr:Zeatin O-glucosyltransferase [Sesamum angolense]
MEPAGDHQDDLQVAVVMVAFPCQSHLNQLLQLSTMIASYGLQIHFVGSATHNRQAKLRSNGLKPNSRIQFHDLPTPPIAALDPDPNASDKLPFHLYPAVQAYANLRKPVLGLVEELSLKTRRVVIIYDRLMFEAVGDAVSVHSVEAYAFNCLSAFTLFFVRWETMGKPFVVEGPLKDPPPATELMPEEVLQLLASRSFKERAGEIHNTSRSIDGTYIDLLSREEISGSSKQQWAIRPTFLQADSTANNDRKPRHKCLEWLDKQAPGSVIYVSFGTTTSFTNEEAREIAIGLEQSKQKFILVLRDADKADIFAAKDRKIELSEGFEERVQENGMVVRDWAPQLEILSHKSTGGFMSHCGWNSCFESLLTGVPVAAWPMHSDQPLNALFLTRVLKTGLLVREWAERKELVTASVIKNVVERLMASEEGVEIRKSAEELSAAIKVSMDEGGEAGCPDMESFISHITR